MKRKQSAIALALILVSAAIATEPAKDANPHPEALQMIQTQIVSRLSREVPPFSRVAPPRPQPRLHPQMLVNGETRIPFEVLAPAARFTVTLDGQAQEPPVLVSGYVRQSDNTVFVFKTATQKHVPATEDPRFAPPQQVKSESGT